MWPSWLILRVDALLNLIVVILNFLNLAFTLLERGFNMFDALIIIMISNLVFPRKSLQTLLANRAAHRRELAVIYQVIRQFFWRERKIIVNRVRAFIRTFEPYVVILASVFLHVLNVVLILESNQAWLLTARILELLLLLRLLFLFFFLLFRQPFIILRLGTSFLSSRLTFLALTFRWWLWLLWCTCARLIRLLTCLEQVNWLTYSTHMYEFQLF